MRGTDKPNCSTWTTKRNRHLEGYFGSHTFQNGFCASLRYLKHVLNSLVPTVAQYVGGPKLAGQGQPLGLMAQHNDLFGPQAASRQRGAQTYRPITDDHYACAWLDVSADCCMMACRHDISERKKCLEQGLIALYLWGDND
jgi:hypothetical protein